MVTENLPEKISTTPIFRKKAQVYAVGTDHCSGHNGAWILTKVSTDQHG
jgi:hypothetical protein